MYHGEEEQQNFSDSKEKELYAIRHSTSHIMAQAVLEMFPEGQITIGPPIENGFYYDFDLPRALTPEDLEKIEARMRQIVKENHQFVCSEKTKEEALDFFSKQKVFGACPNKNKFHNPVLPFTVSTTFI